MNHPIYEFHYPDKNITQKKVLIPVEVYKAYRAIKDDDEAKRYLKLHTNGMEWFIPGSPFYRAIETGVVSANGNYPVQVTKFS